MFALATLLLLFMALTAFRHTPHPGSSPTTLPSSEAWNHEPFNVTTYLESAGLEAAGDPIPSNRPSAQKRTFHQTGAYTCQNGGWRWPCWWQPAKWQCVNTVWDYSCGPDNGVWCTIYRSAGCNSNNIMWRGLRKPGNADTVGSGSWSCGEILNEWRGVSRVGSWHG